MFQPISAWRSLGAGVRRLLDLDRLDMRGNSNGLTSARGRRLRGARTLHYIRRNGRDRVVLLVR